MLLWASVGDEKSQSTNFWSLQGPRPPIVIIVSRENRHSAYLFRTTKGNLVIRQDTPKGGFHKRLWYSGAQLGMEKVDVLMFGACKVQNLQW